MIQARYGWTDQTIFELPAARFLQIIETILKAKEHEQREKFILEAYNAWQVVEVVKGIMSDKAKGTKFSDYLKKLGLLEKPKLDSRTAKLHAAIKEREKEKALSIAEQIKLADKQQAQGR